VGKYRCGHCVIFDDTKGKESITIKGNIIYFDTQAKSITISAPETITINAKNINVNASENLNTSVGMNHTETVGMNKTEQVGMMKTISVGANFVTNVVGKLMEFITGDKESRVEKGKTIINNGEGVNISSDKTIVKQAQSEIKVNSAEKTKYH